VPLPAPYGLNSTMTGRATSGAWPVTVACRLTPSDIFTRLFNVATAAGAAGAQPNAAITTAAGGHARTARLTPAPLGNETLNRDYYRRGEAKGSCFIASLGAPRRQRVRPGDASEIGRLNALVTRAAGVATGGEPPKLFTTIARHRRLFRRWLRFAGALMPGGVLPREDTELVILRAAHNCHCDYEWRHHERLAGVAGLAPEEIDRVREGPGASSWTGRQELLLRAADELHAERTISDPLWSELHALYSDVELIELCMLVGHYEMLAMTLNALGVQPDRVPAGPPPRLARLLQRAVRS